MFSQLSGIPNLKILGKQVQLIRQCLQYLTKKNINFKEAFTVTI